MDARDVYLVQPAPEDIERHLERPITATIGTLNADGSIHLAFVLFLWEYGKFYCETASMTKKARNVASREMASFAIEGKGFMAIAEGRARVIGGDEAHALNARLRRKYLTAPAAGTVGAAWGTVDDISIEITPTKWRSWSNSALSELGEQAAGGLPRHEWWVAESE